MLLMLHRWDVGQELVGGRRIGIVARRGFFAVFGLFTSFPSLIFFATITVIVMVVAVVFDIYENPSFFWGRAKSTQVAHVFSLLTSPSLLSLRLRLLPLGDFLLRTYCIIVGRNF